MWERVGQIIYPAEAGSEDKVLEAAIEAGAEDVESDLVKPDIYEDAPGHTIITAFEDLQSVADALVPVLGDPKSTAIIWRPKAPTPVDADAAASVMKLIDALDDEDDVQNVYAGMEVSDEEMAKLAG
jgi:transcriptional/translational regulatory protein YebC/TACO1